MRLVLVALALTAVLAAPASAAVSKRPCSSRAEGQRPIRQLTPPGGMRIGPVAFASLARVADREGFEEFAPQSRGRNLLKAPLFVRAGRMVTVTIAPADRAVAGLTFDNDAPLRTGVPAVKFTACDKDERAFFYDGTVGPVTAFAGGFTLAGPRCVSITVRMRGRRAPYRRTIPFGVGRC